MNRDCALARDLAGQFEEETLRPESREFVEKHRRDCLECEAWFREEEKQAEREALPLAAFRQALLRRKMMAAVAALCLGLVLAVTAAGWLTAQEYLSYEESGVRVAEGQVTFGEETIGAELTKMGETCWVAAWTTPLERMLRGKNQIALDIPEGTARLYYASYDGETDDVLLLGEGRSESVRTLPRLAMRGYFLIAAAMAAAAGLAWGVLWLAKGSARARLWLGRAGLAPTCWVIAELLATRGKMASYALTRDLMLTLLVTILLYCGGLLCWEWLRGRRMLKKLR